MKKSVPIIAAVAFLSGCASLEEAYKESPLASALAQFDEDGDGVLSETEAEADPGLSENFSRIDTNDSGGIDADEYTAATINIDDLSFEQVDINADGVISEREAAAMPVSLNEAFGTVDADGDSNVSPTEYQAAQTNLLQTVDFASLDTDGDGVIGTEEANEAPPLAEAYELVDTDADGLISEDEYSAAQAAQR
jgi:Ca2+-binding EF-hand superfamily protein